MRFVPSVALPSRTTSVSYTHLDVYKRQELYGSKEGDHLIQRCAKIILFGAVKFVVKLEIIDIEHD